MPDTQAKFCTEVEIHACGDQNECCQLARFRWIRTDCCMQIQGIWGRCVNACSGGGGQPMLLEAMEGERLSTCTGLLFWMEACALH
jgi:hypothetical protein